MFLLPADDLSPNAPNDKVTHLLTFAALALSGRWAGVPVLPLLGGLTAYAAATEVLQAVLPINRHADPRDLVADRRPGCVVGLAPSAGRWLGGARALPARGLTGVRRAGRCPCRPPG